MEQDVEVDIVLKLEVLLDGIRQLRLMKVIIWSVLYNWWEPLLLMQHCRCCR